MTVDLEGIQRRAPTSGSARDPAERASQKEGERVCGGVHAGDHRDAEFCHQALVAQRLPGLGVLSTRT